MAKVTNRMKRPRFILSSLSTIDDPPPSVAYLFLEPLIQPIENRRIEHLRVLRLEHPMPFVGKVQQSRRDPAPLQRGEELEPLVDRNAEVELALRHERRRLEV